MKNHQYFRWIACFGLLVFLLLLILILNVNYGSVSISPRKLFDILFFHQGEMVEVNIVWKIRLPRICMAVLLGGALSLSGFLLQTFFNNPIAGPFVLGISSGAKMVVAFVMIYGFQHFGSVSSYTLIGAAFLGSLLSMGFILLLSRKLKHMAVLLIAGIMIGYICSAVTDFIVTFASDADIVNLHGWSLGSFSGSSFSNVAISAWLIGSCLVGVLWMSKAMGAYQFGETYAKSLGVNIQWFRFMLILFSSLLSACVTAFAGPISFVGIAVPHLMKRMMHTTKPLLLIPAVVLGGATFCAGCDLIARTAFAPTELSISTVTSIFGAPIVIMMMLRKQKGN